MFEQPDGDVNHTSNQKPPRPRGDEADLAVFQQRLKETDGLATFGIIVGMMGSVFPALGVTGFFFDFDLPVPLLAFIAAVCTLPAFCLFYPDRKYFYAGILPGIVTGPLILYLTIWYTQMRASIFSAEVIIPAGIGCLPGIGLYYLSLRIAVLRDLRRRRDEEAEE